MTETTQDAAVILDTPAQINGWQYLSAVSQLTSEIETGRNWYGKTSTLTALVRRGIFPPQRATRTNKMLALAMLIHDVPGGPVVDHARKALAKACAEDGVIITMTEPGQ